ncbi:hypothetical protein [Nocardia inohanensis]|uniref:hypothetical protein n=1 Tax=Nocardia inohanensis TaxID=209246 RepID=UPI000830DA4D|nr:hypothetical protein [Nocardia inohanensis]
MTDDLIISDRTPEFAVRIPADDIWMLTWLLGHALTREQAISAMTLDETLSDPAIAAGDLALELAAMHAEVLGLDLREAVLRLSVRMLEREHRSGRIPLSISRGS